MEHIKLNTLINNIWKIFNQAETVDSIFNGILKTIVENSKANFGLVYLEDDSVLVDLEDAIDHETGNDVLFPVCRNEFLLSYQYYKKAQMSPIIRIPKASLKLNKNTKISNSIFYQTVSPSKLGLKNSESKKNTISTFDSPKTMLCRAVFFIAFEIGENICDKDQKTIANFLDYTVPVIESVYRRQIDRLSRKIISSSEGLYTLNPGDYFQNSYKEICYQLQIEGSSLIVRGLPSSETPLQLISAYPKKIPKDRNIYKQNCFSPTQWIFNYGESCLIPSIFTLRKKLKISCDQKMKDHPIWCDSEKLKEDRAILYNFSKREEGIQYLFRCTNSKKNPSKLFNILDRKIGHELVVSFGLMHKAIENEQRAMKIFLDVKHEFRQKLVGINSATNYVKKSIVRQKDNEYVKTERILKLGHIKDTTKELVKMLDRFNFPLPTIEKDSSDSFTAIKPYADLVKPICETFFEVAKKDGNYFTYHKTDQLGLIYTDISQWRQVIENIVNNMVKYTFPNEEMAIAFERIPEPEGGGKIHFASRSIPISKDERVMLFEYKYRSKPAIEKTSNGEGLGLSIAKFIVAKYGGQILINTKNDINVFSIKLPRHMFRPPTKLSE